MIDIIHEILDDELLECFDPIRVEMMDKYVLGDHVIVNYMMWSTSKLRLMQIRLIISHTKEDHIVIDLNHNKELAYIDLEDRYKLRDLMLEIQLRLEQALLTTNKWRIGVLTGAVQIQIK